MVLRGFAILGIFIANLGGFSWYNENAHLTGPYLLPELDHKMSFLHHMFIEGKFYSIFSLLFGWGIALQFKRAEAKAKNALPMDIVFSYSMPGWHPMEKLILIPYMNSLTINKKHLLLFCNL